MPLPLLVGCPFASPLWCTFYVPRDLKCLTKNGAGIGLFELCESLKYPSKTLQSSLDTYVQRLPPLTQEGSEEELSPMFRTQARLTHAMILSLLGVFRPLLPIPHSLILFTGRRGGHGSAISPTQGRNTPETRSKRFPSLFIHISDLHHPPANTTRRTPTDLGVF